MRFRLVCNNLSAPALSGGILFMNIHEYAGKEPEGPRRGEMGENTKSPVLQGFLYYAGKQKDAVRRYYMNAEGLVVGSAVPGFLPWANSKAEVGVISGKYSLNSAIVQSSIFPS